MKLALRLVCLLPMTALALDLRPLEEVKVLEGGVKISVLKFKDFKDSAIWKPPLGWLMTYGDGVLYFRIKDRVHASLEMRVIPRAEGDAAALGNPEKLLRLATTYLPRTATEILAKGTAEGPFTINALAAHEFLFDFQEPAHASRASFSVVDLNDKERLIVLVTAQPKDFDEVRKTAVESLFSWEARKGN